MSHHCPWPGCTQEISPTRWGCRAHWYRLPNNLRAWIGRAYRIGVNNGTHPTESWRRAHQAALAWAAIEAERERQAAREVASSTSEKLYPDI